MCHKEHGGEEIAKLDNSRIDFQQILIVSGHLIQFKDSKELQKSHELESTKDGKCLRERSSDHGIKREGGKKVDHKPSLEGILKVARKYPSSRER